MSDKTKAPWLAPVVGAATGILGMIGQRARERRAMRNQRQLMGVQHTNQRNLNQQGHDLQYEMWEKTNYKPQMEMMKKAGLNPSLMYGMSGGGGTTTGSQGGGSAASGSAPAPQPMELGNALQGAMMQSQIELAKSQATKNIAEADSIRGKEGTIGEVNIKKMLQETITERLRSEKTWWETETEKGKSGVEFEKAKQINMENKVLRETLDEQVLGTKAEMIGKEIENKLNEAKVNLTEEQTRKVYHDIIVNYVNAGLKGLDIIVKGAIAKMLGKMKVK